jgi:hypothetical protein
MVLESIINCFVFAKTSSVVYLRCTAKAQSFLTSEKAQMKIRLPKRAISKAKTQTAARKSISSTDGWIGTKASKPTKRKGQSKAPASKKKRAPKKQPSTTKRPAKEPKSAPGAGTAKPKTAEVIELDESSLSEASVDGEVEEISGRKASLRKNPQPAYAERDTLWDDDSENEF